MDKNNLLEARFIKRKNRFVGIVDIYGKYNSIYIPNTGRLSELLHPGRKVILTPYSGKFPYKLQYVIHKGKPVFIDSVSSNRIFHNLLQMKRAPLLTDYAFIKREPSYGDHRFDFLLSNDSSGKCAELFVEIKSCTLAWNNIASFPDAPTIRGIEHIRALADCGRGMLVFLIFHGNIDYFVPNYHTSFDFYTTLKQHKDKIKLAAYSVEYGQNYEISALKEVEIIHPDVKPSGCYLLIYENPVDLTIEVGRLGRISFRRGFYIYAGSGKNNVFKRIQYHRRSNKKKHWHVDYIKEDFKLNADIPIVTKKEIECVLAKKIKDIGGEEVTGFGSSDCGCNSHFFYFQSDPLYMDDFWDIVLEERFTKTILDD